MGDDADATPGGRAPQAPDHRPVLLHPLIESLQPTPGQVAIDATLGAGGITAALADRVVPGGHVLAIDRDPAAVAHGRELFADRGDTVIVDRADFADLEEVAARHGIAAAAAVVLDLGISSVQLDDPARGFGFRADGPLDMRLDREGQRTTAADIVNGWPEGDLARLLTVYGEEPFARRIAAAIVRRRRERPLRTTGELRRCVESAVPRHRWPKRIHPATRTFQALRIEVNHEMDSLERGLQAAINVLQPGGRLGVISFHSLEDTRVKNALHVAATNCVCPPQQPICTCAHRASLLPLTRRPIRPDGAELAANPRARSARLRVAEKLPTPSTTS